MHVLAPQCRASGDQRGSHDHRVIDRELIPLRYCVTHLMGLDRQILDKAQGLDAREKSSGVVTAEPACLRQLVSASIRTWTLNRGPCPSISTAGVPAPLSFARQLPSMFNVDNLDSFLGATCPQKAGEGVASLCRSLGGGKHGISSSFPALFRSGRASASAVGSADRSFYGQTREHKLPRIATHPS